MRLLVDIDSAVYKAGFSNQTRSYQIVDTSSGNIVAEYQYKKDVDAFIEKADNAKELEAELCQEAGPVEFSLANAKSVCHTILKMEHTSYQFYLAGKGNFRYDLYPEYKAGRSSKPIHYEEIREYLVKRWKAIHVDGEEADDRVSWEQCMSRYPTCIVAIDKDLLNTPGLNYNYDTQVLTNISLEEANLNFARQLLTGDMTDNIPGLKGIGKKTAHRLLPTLLPNWKEVVMKEYEKQFGEDAEEKMVLYGRLLWMRRKPEEMWDLSYEC